MIEFSSSLKLNKIRIVVNEDPKNINLFQGGPNLGAGTAGKFREMGNDRDIYCYAIREWSISKENISPYPLLPKSL